MTNPGAIQRPDRPNLRRCQGDAVPPGVGPHHRAVLVPLNLLAVRDSTQWCPEIELDSLVDQLLLKCVVELETPSLVRRRAGLFQHRIDIRIAVMVGSHPSAG